MASDKSMKRPPVDFTFHTLSVPITRTGSYGLKFQGNAPVMISGVTRGSSADKAGVKVGDFLIALNGNDVQASTEDAILVILKYSHGAALVLRVGRPHPLPLTDLERRKAILTLQTKLRSGDYVTCGDEVNEYKSTIQSALDEVGDILGDLGLPDPNSGGTVQEVEVALYDSDSLDSPPPSSEGSQVNLNDDPLLDFTRDDEFVHRGGSETAGADLARNVREAQKALQGMKQIMKETSAAKEKKIKTRETTQSKPSVRTEAAFTPSYPPVHTHPTRTQPSAVTGTKQDKTQSDSFEMPTEEIQWTQSPLTSGGGVSGSHVTSRSSKPAPKRTEKSPPPTQTTKRTEKSPPPPQTKRSVSPPSKDTPPPPVPKYNPQGKDSFPLSNRQDYRDERMKTTHTYESVKDGRGVTSRDVPSQGSQGFNVPLRNKKKVTDRLPSPEPEGYVSDGHRKKGSKQSFEPTPVSEKDVSSLASSCSGLPTNVHDWRKEEVGRWIKQLSVSLYAHYYPLFSRHEITGRTLLRLTGSKLKNMGITNAVHCRILATEIAKLKIRQEQAELKELVPADDDEDNEVTFL